MFTSILLHGVKNKLYYHKTDGGAEYLTDKCNESGEGIFDNATILIRVDGNQLEIIRLPNE